MKVSSKWEITIPKAIRESRGWKPGQVFTVEDTKDGILLRPIRRSSGKTLSAKIEKKGT